MNPLDEYKKCLTENFKLGTHIIRIKTLSSSELEKLETSANATENKIKTLSSAIVSVDNIELKDFDSVKNSLQAGKTLSESICEEIGNWDSEVINILYHNFSTLVYRYQKEKENDKDLSQKPQLRFYWKLRKMFSKEEIDSWDSIDWDWAFANLREDIKERQKLIEDIVEYIKPYLNFDLYKWEHEKNTEKKMENSLDNKAIQKEFNTDKVQFDLGTEGGDVFDDNIPLIMEE